MDLAQLQARVEEILGELHHPRVGSALALAEETGEVADLVLKRECYGLPIQPEAIGAELADVLVCVAELATLYGLDLAAVTRDKLEDLATRAPDWAKTLGPMLAERRRRMDGPD